MTNPSSNTRQAHIAVIGGGFTGLVCALTLLKAGYRVTLLEGRPDLGGLTTSFDFGPFVWDKFYHCILTSDRPLLDLLEELGLRDEVRWTATEVGFFSHGQLYKMTGPRDLARFPHLSFFNKARLGLATLYASHLRRGDRLEGIPLETWTRRLFGKRVYQEVWEPLFRCKLGEMRHQASAAFLWGTLRRLYSTREKGPRKQEKLGYVRGGYQTVFNRLRERVQALGADVRTGVQIRSVAANAATANTAGTGVRVSTSDVSMVFDGAIMTVPNRVVQRCLETGDAAYQARLGQVQYLGLICVVLLLRRRLSPYYVTNITEQSPFTGVIEMTNLIDRERETSGFHLVYLPRYSDPGDPLFDADDEEIWTLFAPALQRIHPELEEADIAGRFCFRERTVQPVPTLGYSTVAPPAQTPVPGVYLANTAQIINNTLNNNVMTSLARAACAELMRSVPTHRSEQEPRMRAGLDDDALAALSEEAPCVSV